MPRVGRKCLDNEGHFSMMTEREAQRRDRQRAQAPSPSEQRARSIPAAGSERRWRRKALADLWGISERTVDRMRADGRLGKPCGYIGAGRLPIWSDEQRLAAEQP